MKRNITTSQISKFHLPGCLGVHSTLKFPPICGTTLAGTELPLGAVNMYHVPSYTIHLNEVGYKSLNLIFQCTSKVFEKLKFKKTASKAFATA